MKRWILQHLPVVSTDWRRSCRSRKQPFWCQVHVEEIPTHNECLVITSKWRSIPRKTFPLTPCFWVHTVTVNPIDDQRNLSTLGDSCLLSHLPIVSKFYPTFPRCLERVDWGKLRGQFHRHQLEDFHDPPFRHQCLERSQRRYWAYFHYSVWAYLLCSISWWHSY